MLDNLAIAEWVESLEWLGGFLLLALIARVAWVYLVYRRLKGNPSGMIIAKALHGLFFSALVLIGIAKASLAVKYIEENPRLGDFIAKGLSIAWIILFAVMGVRAVNAGFALQELGAGDSASRLEMQDLRTRQSLYRKILLSLIGVVAIVYTLRIMGADLGPLLAGGTIGGIVLGLALQESLSNFFAGIFLNMDRPAKVGDLVRMENGHEGFVEEIGWRSTKVRLWTDAMLVIPNAKFSSSWIINFHQPAPNVWVTLDCEVDYGSDLAKTEQVAIQAAKAAMGDVGYESDAEPYVRWREFAASGILLRIFMPSSDPETQYRMKSWCIRHVDRLFKEHGISIAYPVQRNIGGFEKDEA